MVQSCRRWEWERFLRRLLANFVYLLLCVLRTSQAPRLTARFRPSHHAEMGLKPQKAPFYIPCSGARLGKHGGCWLGRHRVDLASGSERVSQNWPKCMEFRPVKVCLQFVFILP